MNISIIDEIYKAKKSSSDEWVTGNLQIEQGAIFAKYYNDVTDIEILTDNEYSYPIDYKTCCENAGFVDTDGALVFDGDLAR